MKTSTAIIIFTKDRPSTLVQTLEGIKNQGVPIIVIDDSYLIDNRTKNEEKIKKYSCTYHGRKEQFNLLRKDTNEGKTLAKFTSKLGNKGWNLGFVRNYAIILSRSLRLKKVLFMDDDIIVEDSSLIAKIFSLLDQYDFVGSKITGMIDDSVVGHILRELNYQPEEYFSGGFIGFNPTIVTEYFINEYNEDWIWLYLHQAKFSCLMYGEVKQLPFNKFMNAINKAKKQEIGEILVDGVKEIFKQKSFGQLKREKLWSRLLIEKQEYYSQLIKLSLRENKREFCMILESVATYSAKLKSAMFVEIFKEYFINRREWNRILKSL